MSLTHDFKLGASAPLLIPYPSCHIEPLHLLQPASLRAVPDIDGQPHVQDKHISTIHGAPCKTGLVGEEGEEGEEGGEKGKKIGRRGRGMKRRGESRRENKTEENAFTHTV